MKTTLKQSVTGALALAIIATSFPAHQANAQSTSSLQAQIAALLTQIQQLQIKLNSQTLTSLEELNLTRDLRIGSTGSDVLRLQKFLNSDSETMVAISGPGSKNNETTYFGPATHRAVINFQNKYRNEILLPAGLSQGTGYVGPSTRAKIKSLSTKIIPIDTNPKEDDKDEGKDKDKDTVIVPEEGDITVTRGSEHTNTLPLSGSFQEIYSIDIKADDSSMTINRMDFVFDKRPWRYLDSLALYQDGKKITEIKVDETTVSSVGNEYRLRLSGLNATVAKGDKDTFVLEAKALKNISSSRINDTLSVYVPRNGVRALDTAKFTAQEPKSDLSPRVFDFRDAEGDGEITVSLNNDSPSSKVFQVKNNTNSTNNVVMIATVKAEDSDIELEEMYIKVDGSESNVNNVVKNLSLVFNNKTIATENVVKNSGNAITGIDEDGNTYTIIETNEYYVHFNKLTGIKINEDVREKITLAAEFYKQSGRYSNGTDVTFTIRSVEGENINGENIVNGNLTVGNNRSFLLYTEGLDFNFVKQESDTKGNQSNIGSYTLQFNVTAFGNDIYVPISSDRQIGTSTIGTVGAEYSITNGSGERYASGQSSEVLSIKDARETEDGYYRLDEGSTYEVILKVSLNNVDGISDFYKVELEAFRFKIGNSSGTEHTIESNFGNFKTNVTYIKN